MSGTLEHRFLLPRAARFVTDWKGRPYAYAVLERSVVVALGSGCCKSNGRPKPSYVTRNLLAFSSVVPFTFYHTGSGTDSARGEYQDNYSKIGKPIA